MTAFDVDAQGFPVLLAAEAAPAETKTGSEPPAEAPLVPTTRPASVDAVEWARRMDAVREAAREFEDLSEQDLRERLRGATSRPLADADLTGFRADVRAQQLDDLLDLLDQAERGKLRSRRTVRVSAPRGYLRKTIGSLTTAELTQLETRLRARGWTDKQVRSGLTDRLPKSAQQPSA